ncbi:MAG TPA: hypothetical protein VF918_21155 [Anaerolineales bacterium]
MAKYIFLDNWVLSRLPDIAFASRLSNFIKTRDYTILITHELMAELYNPGWKEAGDRDRGFVAASFMGAHPSVIVHPIRVFQSEYRHFPKNINIIPVELDLKILEDEFRQGALLKVLRRDPLLLQQGIDIQKWSNDLKSNKDSWLDQANQIINNGLQNGILKQNEKGEFIVGNEEKEVALTSLDLRLFDNVDIESFLTKASIRKEKTGKLPRLRGTRIVSLCYWYTFIEIDKANKLKQQSSDIVDHYHLGLLPYCSAFTIDTNMYRLLEYVAKDIDLSRCDLYSPKMLDEAIANL